MKHLLHDEEGIDTTKQEGFKGGAVVKPQTGKGAMEIKDIISPGPLQDHKTQIDGSASPKQHDLNDQEEDSEEDKYSDAMSELPNEAINDESLTQNQQGNQHQEDMRHVEEGLNKAKNEVQRLTQGKPDKINDKVNIPDIKGGIDEIKDGSSKYNEESTDSPQDEGDTDVIKENGKSSEPHISEKKQNFDENFDENLEEKKKNSTHTDGVKDKINKVENDSTLTKQQDGDPSNNERNTYITIDENSTTGEPDLQDNSEVLVQEYSIQIKGGTVTTKAETEDSSSEQQHLTDVNTQEQTIGRENTAQTEGETDTIMYEEDESKTTQNTFICKQGGVDTQLGEGHEIRGDGKSSTPPPEQHLPKKNQGTDEEENSSGTNDNINKLENDSTVDKPQDEAPSYSGGNTNITTDENLTTAELHVQDNSEVQEDHLHEDTNQNEGDSGKIKDKPEDLTSEEPLDPKNQQQQQQEEGFFQNLHNFLRIT